MKITPMTVLKRITPWVLVVTTTLGQAAGARFFGRLTNGAGDPIPSAVIVLCNADANLWFMTSTDGNGGFELSELPPNQFAIEILSPQWRRQPLNPRGQILGYSPWTDSMTLRAAQSLQRNIQLGGVIPQPRTSQTSPPCTPRRAMQTFSPEFLWRSLIEQATPVYPPSARDADIEAQVELEAFMNKEGKVISLRLLVQSWPPKIDPVLTRAAVEAVRNWRYSPPQPLPGREIFEFGGPVFVGFARDR